MKHREKIVRANLYMPAGLLERVDRYVEKLAEQDPLCRAVTRTDAVRVLLTKALELEEN